MSSTISTGRRAATFRFAGQTWVALFETTYETNISPVHSSEECMYFGDVAGAVRQAILFASVTSGGSLRGASHSFTASGYLRSWLSALKAPGHLSSIDVRPSNASESELRGTLDRLRDTGKADYAARLEALGKTGTINLYREASFLAALTRTHEGEPRDCHIPAWRLIQPFAIASETPDATAIPDLGKAGHQPLLAKAYTTPVRMYAQDCIFLRGATPTGRSFCCINEPWAAESEYLRFIAEHLEDFPSLAAAAKEVSGVSRMIRSGTLPPAPDAQTIVVDMTPRSWESPDELERLNAFVAARSDEERIGDKRIRMTLADVFAAACSASPCQIPPGQISSRRLFASVQSLA